MVKSQKGLAVKKSAPNTSETTPAEGEAALSRARAAVADRRCAILDCADEVFLEKGFQAASMSSIAAILGGSKGTLYNYFPSKEQLFIATVTRHCTKLQSQMSSIISEGKGFEDTLFLIGKRFVEVVYSDDIVGKFRMIVAEAGRTPELGHVFYEMGPKRGAELLARYLETARGQGLVAFSDSLRAARHFLSLCDATFAKARYLNALQELEINSVEEEVRCAVRVFMAAYAAPEKKRG